jgi:hypothetical protein
MALPAQLLQFLRTHTVVGEQAPFVAPHAQVINEQDTGRRVVRGGIEGASEGSQDAGNILVKLANFATNSTNHFRLVRREMVEGLHALCMLDLEEINPVALASRSRISYQFISQLPVHLGRMASISQL